jgi:chitinase
MSSHSFTFAHSLQMMLLLLLFCLGSFARAFSATGNNNVALYWGQNSAGGIGTQQTLATYCQDSSTDIVLLAFLDVFFGIGNLPEVNFGPSCDNEPTFPGSNLLQCPQIGNDIKTCQSLGKKVLLSLGGAVGSYGFNSDTQAQSFANEMWNMFGGGSSSTRPFGNAVVDGFDLDIEGGLTTGYVAFVNQLKANFNSDRSKSYYISAAPQCPIPDANLNNALVNAPFDFIFVQFYNNYCGMQTWQPGATNPNFNFGEWDSFVKTQSFNPDAKIYLGVAASPTAAGSGYVSAATVGQAAKFLQATYSTFGGVMMWDASQAWNNVVNGQNFAQAVKAAFLGGVAPPAVSLAVTTSSTTTSTTSPVVSSSSTAPASSTKLTSSTLVVTSSAQPVSSAQHITSSQSESRSQPISSSQLATSSLPASTSDSATENSLLTSSSPSSSSGAASSMQLTSSSTVRTPSGASPSSSVMTFVPSTLSMVFSPSQSVSTSPDSPDTPQISLALPTSTSDSESVPCDETTSPAVAASPAITNGPAPAPTSLPPDTYSTITISPGVVEVVVNHWEPDVYVTRLLTSTVTTITITKKPRPTSTS